MYILIPMIYKGTQVLIDENMKARDWTEQADEAITVLANKRIAAHMLIINSSQVMAIPYSGYDLSNTVVVPRKDELAP